ncbi:MAG: hypothetical protein AVDCRST_MAG65-470, partial [uncultured Solirubrobacteraceae bacterium]
VPDLARRGHGPGDRPADPAPRRRRHRPGRRHRRPRRPRLPPPRRHP